jgi:hypothetical protein
MGLGLKGKKQSTTKKSTSEHTGTLDGKEAREEAAVVYEIGNQIKELQGQLAVAKTPLIERVQSYREKQMGKGKPIKTVKVSTGDDHEVQVQFTERYTPLDRTVIPTLQSAFGSDYSHFAEETETIKFKRGTTEDAIKATIGEKAYKKLAALLDVSKGVKPRKDMHLQIAKLFSEGEEDKAEGLLEFVDACAPEYPTVKV